MAGAVLVADGSPGRQGMPPRPQHVRSPLHPTLGLPWQLPVVAASTASPSCTTSTTWSWWWRSARRPRRLDRAGAGDAGRGAELARIFAQGLELAAERPWLGRSPRWRRHTRGSVRADGTRYPWAEGGTSFVDTTLRAVSDHALVYVQDDHEPLPFEDPEAVAAAFDAIYAPTRTIWGEEPDVDGNGRVILIVTPLTGFMSVVQTGGLFGGNAGEIVYGATATPSVLVHEFTRIITYHRKRSGGVHDT